MRWRLDPVTNNTISGWVYDESSPESELLVLCVNENTLFGQATANTPRPELDGEKHKCECGFAIPLADGCDPDSIMVLACDYARFSGSLIIHAPDRSRIGQFLPPYQHFEQLGKRSSASRSMAKLQALALPDLRNISVLDLGCNEGLFCQIAAKAGARRVLGIDASELFIAKAKARVAANPTLAALPIEFCRASWWDIPDEQFDVILFLSAIHYEPRQKELLDHIAARLTPGGLLVLECGALEESQCAWTLIKRKKDLCRFPSKEYLLSTLLENYVARQQGPSVAQSGDPVPRLVLHCRPKRPVVVVTRGKSGIGKSHLTSRFRRKGILTQSSDHFFLTYMTRYRECAPQTPMYAMLAELKPASMNHIGPKLRKMGAVQEFCRDFIASLPLDAKADCLCIEGEIFRHNDIFATLCAELERLGMEVWGTEKAASGQPDRIPFAADEKARP